MNPIQAAYPATRLRRLRQNEGIRGLVRENYLSASDFIWPVFVRSGEGVVEEIPSMPGVVRRSVDKIVEAAIEAIILADQHQGDGDGGHARRPRPRHRAGRTPRRGRRPMIALFDDAGFILGGYVVTFAVIGAFVWRAIGSGRKIGKHDGLMFHTIGQRKGLKIGGGNGKNSNAWYVIDKDVNQNELIVGQGHDHPLLYKKNITVSKVHWINNEIKKDIELSAKIRYRANDYKCRIIELEDEKALIEFEVPQFAIANGQSVVFYKNEICLGGATINSSF